MEVEACVMADSGKATSRRRLKVLNCELRDIVTKRECKYKKKLFYIKISEPKGGRNNNLDI